MQIMPNMLQFLFLNNVHFHKQVQKQPHIEHENIFKTILKALKDWGIFPTLSPYDLMYSIICIRRNCAGECAGKAAGRTQVKIKGTYGGIVPLQHFLLWPHRQSCVHLLHQSPGEMDNVQVKEAASRETREQPKAGELLLRNDVYTLQLQAGMEAHWGQTVQTKGINCIGSAETPPSPAPCPQPLQHHSVPTRCK